MATHEAPMSDRHIPEIVNTTLRRGKFGGYERARSLEGRRFKEERVKEETIITREELDHEVLGHVTAAMPSETAALFMATTALEGEQSLLSFRDGLHERGVDTSQGPFIYRILMNDIERLEGMGFVRPIDSREGAVKTMVPTELGEGLGAIYAGYALSLSEKHGKRLEDVWGKYSSQEREAQIVATEEGVIEYRRRPSEVRVRTIEGIIDAWFVNKIPMGLHQLKRFVDKHEAVPEAQIQRAVKAFARAQLLDYTAYDPKEAGHIFYTATTQRPILEPKPYGKMSKLTDEVDKYVICHIGGFLDGDMTAGNATEFVLRRFPERLFWDQKDLQERIGKILKHFAASGYLERHADYSRIELNGKQKEFFRQAIVGLREVQHRNEDGRVKAAQILQNPQAIQRLIDIQTGKKVVNEV